MHRRPRFDFEAAYFIRAYRTECAILQQEAVLVKSILDKQVKRYRMTMIMMMVLMVTPIYLKGPKAKKPNGTCGWECNIK